MKTFPTDTASVYQRVSEFDHSNYAATRNYIDGGVSYLSPYISRGVISTKQVLQQSLEKFPNPWSIEKFIQELAWRDYWQQVWIEKGDEINQDLKRPQERVSNYLISSALLQANTGISAIDKGVTDLYQTGYVHNHLRMYLASLACNIAQNHWKLPAQWMYYHLIDGDWASNALSWQWVAGSNAGKKYFANQENINKYARTADRNTILDVNYEDFEHLDVPESLQNVELPVLRTELPKPDFNLDPKRETYLFTYYNLDPQWAPENSNKLLILEPSHFEKYPVGNRALNFALDLSKNITGTELFVGEFDQLLESYPGMTFHFKEHPSNRHFKGIEHQRDWMFSVKGYYRSFFAFWKKCKKELSGF